MNVAPASAQARIVGRYALYGEIAAGGMATVHFGRLVGEVGFSRTVAIKRLHPQFAKDPDFVGMFLDEARLAARIQHPNVVSTIDVVPLADEVFLVMEYVHGEALSKLIRAARQRGELVPARIAVSIIAGALHGLHAAHEAKSERGEPLNIVHRDVSPQNILVGTDGVPRVLDFGVAKAAARVTSTRDGQMKGKVSYMAPEQLRGKGVDRRTDVFAAGVVLWEALTGRRLFDGDDPGAILVKLLEEEIPRPRQVEPTVPEPLEELTMKALSRDPSLRFTSAREFAIALEQAGPIALPREVGEWVDAIGGETVGKRAAQVAEIESVSSSGLRTVDDRGAVLVSAPDSRSPFAGSSPQGGGWQSAPGPHGEPSTNPSQVSHVTGVSHSGVSAPSAATGPSQLTSPSQVGRTPESSAGKGVFAALAGVAAALGVVFVVLLAVFFLRGKNKQAEEPDVLPVSKPTAVETKAPAPEAIQPTAPPIVSVTPAPSAQAPPEAEPAPTAKAPAPPPTAVKPKPTWKPTTSKPAGGSKTSCDPPYVIDKNGVRRVKPGCM